MCVCFMGYLSKVCLLLHPNPSVDFDPTSPENPETSKYTKEVGFKIEEWMVVQEVEERNGKNIGKRLRPQNYNFSVPFHIHTEE